MDDEDLQKTFDIGGGDETVSLAQIANLDMEDVEEVRWSNLPKMSGVFEIVKMELTSRNTKQGDRPVLAGTFKVLEVFSCLDDDVTPESLIEREHRQAWFIGVGDPPDPVKDIGRWKAFLVDTGYQATGQINAICDACAGHRFIGVIKQRPDKDDKDIIYSQFDDNKIKPYNPAGDTAAA